MEKEHFLGMNCLAYEVPIGIGNLDRLGIVEFTGSRADIAKVCGNGRFKILTEKDYVLEQLISGRGVAFKERVYFLESSSNESGFYFQFKKKISRFRKREDILSEIDQLLLDALYSDYHFNVAKNILDLYRIDFFSIKEAVRKLELYMPKIKAELIVSDELQKRMAV